VLWLIAVSFLHATLNLGHTIGMSLKAGPG
jgi:hypothetical protein